MDQRASCPVDVKAPFFIILNAGSGRKQTDEARRTIESMLSEAGRKYEIHVIDEPAKLRDATQHLIGEACRRQGVIVAAGGDGTLNTIAQEAVRCGCPLGVLPQGTFNYFARVHGLPLDTVEAVRTLLVSPVQPVQVGMVNERVFLVNASLGLYPKILEDREAYKERYGRRRSVALWASLMTLLREHVQLKLRIDYRGESREIRTPTLFIGNNRLQLEQIGLPEAPLLENHLLAGLILKPVSTVKMLGLALRGALGRLGDAEGVIDFAFDRITVAPVKPYGSRIKVAMDGEIEWMRSPLVFQVAQRPLHLIKPNPMTIHDP